jgi:cytochrome c biogenesis protein
MMTGVFDPILRYRAWEGDLASELQPSFASLDTRALHPFASGIVGAGQTVDVSTGDPLKGSSARAAGATHDLTVSFRDRKQYTVLQISRDRGVWIMLLAAVLILIGLIPALYTSRRKLWVRAEPAGRGSVLKVGGYALQRTTQFEEEFARVVAGLTRAAGGQPGAAEDARDGGPSGRQSDEADTEQSEVVGSR